MYRVLVDGEQMQDRTFGYFGGAQFCAEMFKLVQPQHMVEIENMESSERVEVLVSRITPEI